MGGTSSTAPGEDSGNHHIDYEVDIAHPKGSSDISYGAMTFFRDKNPNGIAPLLQEEGTDSPWLRLAVAKDAYLQATAGDPERCDRCELRDGKLPLGTPVWYSFEMRAEPEFPLVAARCVCAQIKAPYYDADGGSPLFALRIDDGHFIATIEHLYETKDVAFVNGAEVSQYVTPLPSSRTCQNRVRALDHHVFGNSIRDFKELQIRTLLATDSHGIPAHLEDEFRWCTSLARVTQQTFLPADIYKWWQFIVRVAPTSIKDEDGILQLLFAEPGSSDAQLVAEATGEFGHAGDPDPSSNTGPAPGTGLQYFKIGPYRDKIRLWGDSPAGIHVRNIKRGYWDTGAQLRQEIAQAHDA